MEEKDCVTALERNCDGKLQITLATLLHNAQNPLDRVKLRDKDLKSPDLDELGQLFGGIENIKCPTSLFGERIINFLLTKSNTTTT